MLHRVITNGGEPSSWKVEVYADVDGDELFIHRVGTGVIKLLEASLFCGPERAKAKHEITQLLIEGFVASFNLLSKIKALGRTPEMDRRQAYDDFMGTLWQGYKNFLPRAAKELAFDIGFLFQRTLKFEEGVVAFQAKHPLVPKDLMIYFQRQRDGWQGELSRVRNDYVEHRNIEWDDVKDVYCVERAQSFFDSAWEAAENILACLICTNLPPFTGVREVPVAERHPLSPDRFQFVWLGKPLL